MIDILMTILLGTIAFLSPAILITWFFGLRPFVAKHGRARVTAINWFFSMWADWSTAREIEKQIGKRDKSTQLFMGLWVHGILAIIAIVFITAEVNK